MLLLSGYWPVVGTALVLAGQERTILIVPRDEAALAQRGWADEVEQFEPGSLDRLGTVRQAVRDLLASAARQLRVDRGRIGFEADEWYEPASYAAMHLYGAAMKPLLAESLPRAAVESADEMLAELRAVKTPAEIERIRTACRIAAAAFETGAGNPPRRDRDRSRRRVPCAAGLAAGQPI